MRILVIGRGAREHALVWRLAKSPTVDVGGLFATPGNAGIAGLATIPDLPEDAGVSDYADLASRLAIDLTIVGGEDLLIDGIVDEFHRRQLRIFGPTKAAAQLEASKSWAKDLMGTLGIQTAKWRRFHLSEVDQARDHAASLGWRCVIKADGPAAGKGAYVCESEAEVDDALRELLVERRFETETVLIEEFLEGQEVSVFGISDGRTVIPFGAAQDHKRARNEDKGRNTGGMGAYSPVRHLAVAEGFAVRFFQRIVTTLAAQGTPYVGFMYAGAIATKRGALILEFNCRLGDPEAEVLLTRLDDRTDLAKLLLAAADGKLERVEEPIWQQQESLSVVIATTKYQGLADDDDRGHEIFGIDEAASVPGVVIFHAGTETRGGRLITKGGRILAVTALGTDLQAAKASAYAAVDKIDFEGKGVRTDIGDKASGKTWEQSWSKLERDLKNIGLDEVRTVVNHGIDQVNSRLERLPKLAIVAERERETAILTDMLQMIKEVVTRDVPADPESLIEGHSSVQDATASRLKTLRAEFDAILERAQTPAGRAAISAAYRSSPEELGDVASQPEDKVSRGV